MTCHHHIFILPASSGYFQEANSVRGLLSKAILQMTLWTPLSLISKLWQKWSLPQCLSSFLLWVCSSLFSFSDVRGKKNFSNNWIYSFVQLCPAVHWQIQLIWTLCSCGQLFLLMNRCKGMEILITALISTFIFLHLHNKAGCFLTVSHYVFPKTTYAM